MREMLRLFLSVVIFSALAGGLLTALQNSTKDRIEYQQLLFVKGPAIMEILDGCTNDPLIDRFKLQDGETERSFFIGKFDGKPDTVAFETYGGGFGGDIGVMVAVNVETDKIVGIGVTTHSETPGIGSRAKTDKAFSRQFQGLDIAQTFKVKSDGGKVDAISGATVSSKGVATAVDAAGQIYQRLKSEIVKKMQA
ncbi:RnfABCDGE type electron transport complex subunit G [Desulfatiglans anilini]|uniref:RnfABCDGE type electron transport complex subunit G n=1 Tax=Desulfatiglans anilini TaxID=90728 RepID=UPI000423AB8E|nr:RnfABCDGE type electron transport complex subunit G [Desulfatiglans anilini]